MKGEKAPGRELFSSIISAAHRKIRRGDKKSTSQDSRDDLTSPNGVKEFISQTNYSNDLKQVSFEDLRHRRMFNLFVL